MERPTLCPKCKSENIENLSDDEQPDGTMEFWVCADCLCEWGILLKVTQIIMDEDYSNVVRL